MKIVHFLASSVDIFAERFCPFQLECGPESEVRSKSR